MDDEIRTLAEAEERVALPRCRAVHTDPDAPATAEQKPLPEGMSEDGARKSPAEWAYERIILYIQNFEEQLDPDEEIAMGMTDGGAGLLRIEGLGFFAPDIVSFYGRDMEGGRMQLVQHVTQLNVTLRALPKPKGDVEAQRIGFRLAKALSEGPKAG
ncbi:MAG: hypothetical protein JXQ91_08195 [Vannielia sp.]|uniref:hypothetical protein n=1 Tax=Rhodobacterales TaxID=204455 RepID=UPI00209436A9|nr:hypothetical protein [Oceanicola sp. 502str15]MCO6384384.1 hypothetical protein [Oceanicola sp. 502str15]